MNNIINQIPFLRTSRQFPNNPEMLSTEVDKSYVDIANAVNNRTIGIYAISRPTADGNSYFISGNRYQQGFRQVYTFTTSADIEIGFKLSSISHIAPSYGSFTNGTDWFGVVYGSDVPVAGQLGFFVFQDTGSTTTDLIRFTVGGGSPSITRGLIVLEWISNP